MARIIKARFYVAQFNKYAGEQSATVVLNAVNRKTDDNIDWSKYSPSGKFELNVSNVEGGAYQSFEAALGKDVLITMEIVEPELPKDPPTIS